MKKSNKINKKMLMLGTSLILTTGVSLSGLMFINKTTDYRNNYYQNIKRLKTPQYNNLISENTNFGETTFNIQNYSVSESNSLGNTGFGTSGYQTSSLITFAQNTANDFVNKFSNQIELSPAFLSNYVNNDWKQYVPLNINWKNLANYIINSNILTTFNGNFYQYISSNSTGSSYPSNTSTTSIQDLLNNVFQTINNNSWYDPGASYYATPWEYWLIGTPSLAINSNNYLQLNLNISSASAKNLKQDYFTMWWGETWNDNQYTQSPSMSLSLLLNSVTLPFSMSQIQSNISSAIASISLDHYYFESYWTSTLFSNIEANINACIPSYMSNCFTINSTVTNYGTSGNIQTTVTYINNNNETVTWTFNTTVTMPSQPSNESIYNYCNTIYSQPILLESNTSNVWNSNKIYGYTLTEWEQEPEDKLLPTENGFIANCNTDGQILSNAVKYYNGTSNTTSTDIYWITNQQMLNNYLSFLQSEIQDYINTNNSNVANGTPFNSSNPLQYSYNFETINGTNYIITKITFNNNSWNNPNNIDKNSKPSPWIFYTPVTLSNSTYYFSQGVNLRLSISALAMPVAGNSFKMVNDNGFLIPNSQSVTGQSDTNGVINNGTWLYYSNSALKFTGSLDETETLTVNGEQVEVLNNQFSYSMPAPFVSANNQENSSSSTNSSNDSSSSSSSSNSGNVSNDEQASYVIDIYKSGTLIYTETIIVEQGIPSVNYKWYAWDPSKKSWQEKYITQTLSNGKTNPDYNPNINPDTGAVNQILWINQAPINNDPVYYDPYNQYNQPYETSESVPSNDIGYIADGEVFNKGVNITFDTQDAQVQREGLQITNNQLAYDSNPTGELAFANIGQATYITPNSSSSSDYYSYSGLWQYTVNSLYDGKNYFPDNTGIYSFYLIDVINSDVQTNFNYFTSIVNTPDIVPFWDTWHGEHLEYYLENVQNFTQSEISNLTYNDVMFWWNIYCENGITEQYSLNQPFNLANANISSIYMNTSNQQTIMNIITSQVESTLNQANLINNVDYKINVTQEQIEALANYVNDQNKTATETITVTSLNTNVCTGTLNITVTDSMNIINLSNVNFGTLTIGIIGNSTNDINEIQQAIINQVTNDINNYAKAIGSDETLVYNKDFSIDWTNLTQIEFSSLTSGVIVKSAYFTINSLSNNCYGTNQILVNNNLNYSSSSSNSGTFNLSYINISNLFLNVASSNTTDAQAIISNYIFDDIAYAFDTYFKNENLTDSIYAKELTFDWNSTIYKNNEIVYPSTYGVYWTINNYNSVLNTLTTDLSNKDFDNSVVLYITPTQTGSSNLYGSIPLFVSNAYNNPFDPSIPNYTFPPQSVPDQINSPNGSSSSNNGSSSESGNSTNSSTTNSQLASWVIPVAIIGSLLSIVVLYAVWYRLKHKKVI